MSRLLTLLTGLLLTLLVLSAACRDNHKPTVNVEELYRENCVVGFSPRNYDPRFGKFPLDTDLTADLDLLRKAGFTGVVTYTSEGTIADIPRLAKEAGFAVVGQGIWDPKNHDEIDAAVRQKDNVDFYIVGNEGITNNLYTEQRLAEAIREVRERTGKPVSTTEPLITYETHPNLYELGDWVSINHHAWWSRVRDPEQAAEWTAAEYQRIKESLQRDHPDLRADARLVFKEVGMPTAGDLEASEENQRAFFQLIQEQDVAFGYFEAFDMSWKINEPVEPHWGICREDGSCKPAVGVVCGGKGMITPVPEPTKEAPPTALASPTATRSAASPSPFTPTPTPGQDECRLDMPSYYPPAGWMGDIEGIAQDPAYTGTVHPPAPTSIRISYQPGSQGWAGIYFLRTDAQYPQGDWGDEPGYNLSGATKLTFWARGEQGGERVEFKAGGVDSPGKPYQDTFEKSLGVVTLSQEWQQFSIDLSGLDLSDVIGAFAWVATKANNPGGLTFYLSEIAYEGVCELQRAAA